MVRNLSGPDAMTALGAVPPRGADASPFQWRLACARYGPLDIGIVQFTPHTRAMPGDNFGHNHPISRLGIMLEGSQTVSIAGQELTMTPGAGILVPGDMAAVYHASTNATRLHVDIAADHPGFAPLLRNARCGYWPPNTPLLLALSAFVRTLLQRDDDAHAWAGRAAVRSTLEAMVCATIASAPPVRGEELVPGYRELALMYVRTHHVDPSLTPCTVAAGLGLSVRTLQRAFADDRSVAQWIAHFRLETALGFMRDPRFADLTLAEIAARAGFGSAVVLRRAVLAETGLPPSEYRERHVAAALAADTIDGLHDDEGVSLALADARA
jgi:AraC-like DNA-binding protein